MQPNLFVANNGQDLNKGQPSSVQPHNNRPPANAFHMEFLFDIRNNQIKAISNHTPNILGQDVSFLVGRSKDQLLALLPHEDVPVVTTLVSEIVNLLKGFSYSSLVSALITFEIRYALPTGIHKWLRFVVRLIPGDGGTINNIKGDVYDMTDESMVHNINCHIAYLDSFGVQAYRRFSATARNFDNLTPRDQKVLRLMCQGLTSKEIGNLLNISKETVDKTRKTLLSKTGTKNSVELITKYLNTA